MSASRYRLAAALGVGVSAWFAWGPLTVANGQPRIITHPSSQMANLGARVTFRVNATGTAPLSYQWYFDGLELASATNTSLVLTNVQPIQAGHYFAIANNGEGSSTSRVARLDVYVRMGIFDIADPVEFKKILSTNAVLTRMATVNSWIEGVV